MKVLTDADRARIKKEILTRIPNYPAGEAFVDLYTITTEQALNIVPRITGKSLSDVLNDDRNVWNCDKCYPKLCRCPDRSRD